MAGYAKAHFRGNSIVMNALYEHLYNRSELEDQNVSTVYHSWRWPYFVINCIILSNISSSSSPYCKVHHLSYHLTTPSLNWPWASFHIVSGCLFPDFLLLTNYYFYRTSFDLCKCPTYYHCRSAGDNSGVSALCRCLLKLGSSSGDRE